MWSPAEVLSTFPPGLTTAEIALVRRPTDLAEADIAETSRQLIALADKGAVSGEPAGTDFLWRATGTGPEPAAPRASAGAAA